MQKLSIEAFKYLDTGFVRILSRFSVVNAHKDLTIVSFWTFRPRFKILFFFFGFRCRIARSKTFLNQCLWKDSILLVEEDSTKFL
jgi:hypothetical protein